ncbi:MAG TPA: biotin transporter BioY [Candidatus Polarisedimenticolia bacterium]|nr:biotin transporter BioY [Candidatus Polarisedimenticolia bacterium]
MENSLELTDHRPIRIARQAALCVFFALLVAIGGYLRIPIPGTPVPLTLQVVFVLLAGSFLAPSAALASMALFVTLGLAGAPVYAGGGAGLAYLTGPSGGYLLGFILGAFVCALILRGHRDRIGRVILAMSAGLLVIHVLGAAHLGLYLGGDLSAAIRLGIVPFLPGDVLKIAAASAFVAGSAAIGPRR